MVELDELTPFQKVCMDAIAATGIPIVADLNNLDENCGVAPFPTNTGRDGIRMNTAFGYIDPLRDSEQLTVIGDAPVERVLIGNGRAQGVVAWIGGHEVEIRAPTIIVCAGAYGSPALLLRSGIGPAEHLAGAGVQMLHELPGVGENLHDQPTVQVDYSGTTELAQAMRSFPHTGRRREEQVVAKFPSRSCQVGFDLHIFPIGGPRDDPDAAGRTAAFTLGGAVLSPLSRGTVRLTGPRLADQLLIDHRYLSDPDGHDLVRLTEVVERIRAIARQPLLGDEIFPGPNVTEAALADCIASTVVHYYHPAGSCKMGPPADPSAVVDPDGLVHGLVGVFVGDASVMPSVISGNTNMPTIVIGEKLGRHIADQG
jgi:choline dehydrogenase